jgi:hypothetical protein
LREKNFCHKKRFKKRKDSQDKPWCELRIFPGMQLFLKNVGHASFDLQISMIFRRIQFWTALWTFYFRVYFATQQ